MFLSSPLTFSALLPSWPQSWEISQSTCPTGTLSPSAAIMQSFNNRKFSINRNTGVPKPARRFSVGEPAMSGKLRFSFNPLDEETSLMIVLLTP